jgi:phosphate-selective porin OprO/OprP
LLAHGTGVLGRSSLLIAVTVLVLLCSARAFAQQLAWKDHPQIEWGAVRLEFRAQLHAENVDSDGPIRRVEADTFDIARRRFAIDGTMGRQLRFQAEAELEDDEPIRDLYLEYRPARAARIRGGRFKLPFGLEENTSHANLEFVRRTLMSDRLAPGRDDGVMLHGEIGPVDYETGVFVHDGANAKPSRAVRVFGGQTFAGRVRLDASDLQVGAAFTQSELPEGYPAVRGRTVLGASFFDSDYWVAGLRRRAGLELRWRPGPLAFHAEAIRLIDERRRQSLERTDLPRAVTQGWYVSGSWVVAGATRASNVDNPRKPLFGGGFGSLQLAIRHEALMFGDVDVADPPLVTHRTAVIPGSEDQATTAGFTWYATRWTRIQVNVVREQIRGVLPEPVPPARIWDRLIRFQLVL